MGEFRVNPVEIWSGSYRAGITSASRIMVDALPSPLTSPTIVNFTTSGSSAWELAATLPSTARSFTIKCRDMSAEIDFAYSASPSTWITLWPGLVYSVDARPPAIYVRDRGTPVVVEIEYWE
ncbi:MAG: hypothetical protein DRP12_00040 [Candidatus Aenigmatarchaeota archaeon]|nr:MAG: hypothetical protein DRP12_00040 [Candidatus Aenigmarchaeota archaeon]